MHISIFNNIVLLKRIYKKERDFFPHLLPFSSSNINLKEMWRRSKAGRGGGRKEERGCGPKCFCSVLAPLQTLSPCSVITSSWFE